MQTDSCESADWVNSKLLMLMGANLLETRIHDAHYFTEARARGTRVVAVFPDYNATATHADVFVPIKPGTDGALCLGMSSHIVANKLYFHNDLTNRAQILLLALTANVGKPGTGFDHYVGQEKIWPEEAWFHLSYPYGRPKQRFQNTTLWTYVHADVVSDVDDLYPRPIKSYIRESVDKGWMPLWPEDTLDNGRNPKVMFIWGGNYTNQAKGHTDLMKNLLPKTDLIGDSLLFPHGGACLPVRRAGLRLGMLETRGDWRTMRKERFEGLLDESVKIHGHLYPGQVLGVRMAIYGLERIGLSDPRGKDRKKLYLFVEIDRCATDALQSVTGCSLGHRTMRFMDYGKMAATFVNLESGRSSRVVALEESKERAKTYFPEIEDKYRCQVEAYRIMSDEELFRHQKVKIHIPPQDMPGRPLSRVACEVCGEYVQDMRERQRAGRMLCRACADGGYYVRNA